ncbi:fungal alpha-L-arabinofuranosidase [Rhypophila sp. PSN 637]
MSAVELPVETLLREYKQHRHGKWSHGSHYFGNSNYWGSGSGSGPSRWLMADLENGLFSGRGAKYNGGDPSISYRFFTAIVKGQPGRWALRGGDGVSGGHTTYYNGPRPSASGYNPMKKEGSNILGIGGDNSVSAQGTFYEGVMTSGYPSDATENAVQADVVAAEYAVGQTTSAGFSVGNVRSFCVTTSGYDARYHAYSGSTVNTQVVSGSSSTSLKKAASWTVRTGFANSACFSFESRDTSGSYLRHYDFVLQLAANDQSKHSRRIRPFVHRLVSPAKERVQFGLGTIRPVDY